MKPEMGQVDEWIGAQERILGDGKRVEGSDKNINEKAKEEAL
jgi:hypothetical protein